MQYENIGAQFHKFTLKQIKKTKWHCSEYFGSIHGIYGAQDNIHNCYVYHKNAKYISSFSIRVVLVGTDEQNASQDDTCKNNQFAIAELLIDLGPLLLTLINFNPSMDKYYIHCQVWDEITYPFLNFNGSTVEV